MLGPVYWDKTQMQNEGATPSIFAIGDSWFWYPFVGGSLIVPLGDELHHIPAGFRKIAIDAWESLLVTDNLA